MEKLIMRFSITFSAARRVGGLLACLLVSGSLLSANPAAAQDKPDAGSKDKPGNGAADKSPNKSADASDVAPLTIALDDIGELRGLNPLKLTADELDKMSVIIADAQTDYNKKLAANAAPILRKASDAILAAKKKALAGTALGYDETMTKVLTDVEARRKETENATLKSLSDKLQTVLTESQVQTAAKIMKDELIKMNGSAGKGTDAQFFNLYVLRVVMGYPRIVPLLKEMRTAKGK